MAHDKLGHHRKAIDWMAKKRRRMRSMEGLEDHERSDQLYKTFANRGTFHIHAGQYRRGLKFIRRALIVNPQAHFDRERYQKHLVRYLLDNGPDERPVAPPQSRRNRFDDYLAASLSESRCDATRYLDKYGRPSDPPPGAPEPTFGDLLDERLDEENCDDASDPSGDESTLTDKEKREAVRGILGMMRFGNHRSPVLLEALGDLLNASGSERKKADHRLAARAYLSAAWNVEDQKATDGYRTLAERSLTTVPETKLPDLVEKLKAERQRAREWFETVRADEQKWIDGPTNPDEAFQKKYLDGTRDITLESSGGELFWWWILTAVLGVGGLTGALASFLEIPRPWRSGSSDRPDD
ncbi:MAG: hypothetical protein ABEN55_05220 [Bradymonadaceae bacterium]